MKNDVLTTLGTENMALARPSCGDTGSGTRSTKEAFAVSTPSQEVSVGFYSHCKTSRAQNDVTLGLS